MRPKVLYVAGISGFMEPKNGGQIRTHQIIKQLCTEFEVDIFSPYLPTRLESEGISITNNLCPRPLQRLLRWGGRRGFSRLIHGHLYRKGMRSSHPLSNGQFYERSILEDVVTQRHHDYAFIFYDTSRYAPLSPSDAARSKSILIAHNVDSVLDPKSKFHPQFEKSLNQLFTAVIACTRQDSLRLQSSSPGINCIEWPNGTTRPAASESCTPSYDVLFVGALDFKPNIEAADYLVNHTWPLLKQRNLRLCIAGRNPSKELAARITRAGISLKANAPELTSIYQSSKLAVVPLVTGSGSRLKIAEALIHGLPVISTPLGAEGYPIDQMGLTQIPCYPPLAFVEAIEQDMKRLSSELKANIIQNAKPFLWRNTIDLSLLPSC